MGSSQRKVVAVISISLDGRINGPNGEFDMSWIVPHALTMTAREQQQEMMKAASVAIMGRKNYEGFGAYWPSVATDPSADEHNRGFATWLNTIEKVVISRSLTEASWENSRIAGDPVAEVDSVQRDGLGDIYVLSSASIIRTLLEADRIDAMKVTLCPEVVGAGDRLLVSALPPSQWLVDDSKRSETGAMHLTFERSR